MPVTYGPESVECYALDPALFCHGHDLWQIMKVHPGYNGRQLDFQASLDSCFHPRDDAVETAGPPPELIMRRRCRGIQAHKQSTELNVHQPLRRLTSEEPTIRRHVRVDRAFTHPRQDLQVVPADHGLSGSESYPEYPDVSELVCYRPIVCGVKLARVGAGPAITVDAVKVTCVGIVPSHKHR